MLGINAIINIFIPTSDIILHRYQEARHPEALVNVKL